MRKHTQTKLRQLGQIGGLTILSMIFSFTIGMRTAGDVHPFETSQAADTVDVVTKHATVRGDVNRNGILDVQDALLLLQFADGLAHPNTEELKIGDVNNDAKISTEDVRRVLHSLSLR